MIITLIYHDLLISPHPDFIGLDCTLRNVDEYTGGLTSCTDLCPFTVYLPKGRLTRPHYDAKWDDRSLNGIYVKVTLFCLLNWGL